MAAGNEGASVRWCGSARARQRCTGCFPWDALWRFSHPPWRSGWATARGLCFFCSGASGRERADHHFDGVYPGRWVAYRECIATALIFHPLLEPSLVVAGRPVVETLTTRGQCWCLLLLAFSGMAPPGTKGPRSARSRSLAPSQGRPRDADDVPAAAHCFSAAPPAPDPPHSDIWPFCPGSCPSRQVRVYIWLRDRRTRGCAPPPGPKKDETRRDETLRIPTRWPET